MNKTIIPTQKWVALGKLFGYPDCCIESFCLHHKSTEQIWAGNQTGFIPSSNHSIQVCRGDRTIESLIKNREYSKPFPASDYDEEVKRYLKSQSIEP